MTEFGTALYYPYIDIEDPQWLRTAILFWDRIQTIVPSEISDPYQNPETRLLHQEELLLPLHCDLRGELLEDLGRRVLKYVERPDYLHGVLSAVTGATTDWHALPGSSRRTILRRGRQTRLHPGKMSDDVRRSLVGATIDDNGFLLVDRPFGAFYMSALATRLAKDTGAVAVSDEGSAFGLQLNTVLDEVLSDAPSAAEGVLMSVVVESLTLDASVPIERVLRFRRRNENQLQDLARSFEKLTEKLDGSEDLREMREKSGRYYRRTIRPELIRLREALQDADVGAMWTGFRNMVTMTATAGSALAGYLNWPVNFVLGAGAFVTVADIAVQSHLARRKIRRDSPYTYLLDVESRFGLPSHLLD
jgi:hypothetical protein